MLGGAISPDISAARNDVALNEAAERVTAAVALARRYPAARIVFSGGSGALFIREGSEAVAAVRIFESLGIAPERIIAEEQSRNTRRERGFLSALGHAAAGRALAAGHVRLSHAARHGVFRQAGFPVEAYPVDWRTRGTHDALRPFPTVSEGLERPIPPCTSGSACWSIG